MFAFSYRHERPLRPYRYLLHGRRPELLYSDEAVVDGDLEKSGAEGERESKSIPEIENGEKTEREVASANPRKCLDTPVRDLKGKGSVSPSVSSEERYFNEIYFAM